MKNLYKLTEFHQGMKVPHHRKVCFSIIHSTFSFSGQCSNIFSLLPTGPFILIYVLGFLLSEVNENHQPKEWVSQALSIKLRNPENGLGIRTEKLEIIWIFLWRSKIYKWWKANFVLPETYLFWIYKFMKLKLFWGA